MTTTIINKTMPSPYGPATAWVVQSWQVVKTPEPPLTPITGDSSPSWIKLFGYMNQDTFIAKDKPLTTKIYRVSNDDVATVFNNGFIPILNYILAQDDLSGATTTEI